MRRTSELLGALALTVSTVVGAQVPDKAAMPAVGAKPGEGSVSKSGNPIDQNWGVYQSRDHQWLAVGRSPDDAGKLFIYDNQTQDYLTLTQSAEGYCAQSCGVRVRFARAPRAISTLTIVRTGRPPIQARRLPWRAEDVAFVSDGLRLRGRVWLPEGAGPFPAVVIVGGTGPNLRDDFRTYPYVFLKHGFAVLTFDKRGAGQSQGTQERSEEAISPLADDLNAAVAALRTRHDISGSHVGVLGISHGAWVAVEAAARDPGIAFVLPIVGGGIPLWRAQLFDVGNSLSEKGLSSADVAAALAEMRADYALAEAGDFNGVADRIETARHASWFAATPAGPLTSLPRDAIASAVKSIWQGELSYDPGPRLAVIHAPILAIAAGSDRHVPGSETLAAIVGAASASRDVQTLLLPGANHWQGLSADYSEDIHYSGRLFDRLGAWLEQLKRGRMPSSNQRG